MAVRLSRQAEVDLRELWAFVATESGEEPADRVVDALTDACWMLSEYPGLAVFARTSGRMSGRFQSLATSSTTALRTRMSCRFARVLHARRDQSATWESEE